ncbi:MAG: DNA polymerase Y family protein [Burkholderiaceae bacterium]|nr:DNA polymerase Y family protein [Burkholderiaceae bacterium]
MLWIALLPPDAQAGRDEREPWLWHALRFTPRVARLGDALLLEVAASTTLWGGRSQLARRLVQPEDLLPPRAWSWGPTSRVALARMRLAARSEAEPRDLPGGLPLHTLDAAVPHLALLERMGCRTWGDLHALPRGGLARRFGGELLDALDAAWGRRPERYDWCAAPETFDVRVELPALATAAPELMWAGQRLLGQLQAWLGARQRGALAVQLEWTHDLKRLDGVELPPTDHIDIRTARPTQDMAHLRRLLAERLARTPLAAPANHLRLRALDTVAWAGASTSLLPEDNVRGDRLHEFVERVSTRLGESHVLVPAPGDDHRPERMQRWVPARRAQASSREAAASMPDALLPTWLLPAPELLDVRGERPHHHGRPLRLLTRAWQVHTAWWESPAPPRRDYYVAESASCGLLFIYRESALATGRSDAADPQSPLFDTPPMRTHRWFLHGYYA